MPDQQLETWTLKRVLAAMLDNQRTGVLEVTSGSVVTRIHLRKGGVVLVELKQDERQYLVADYLVESGRVSMNDVANARAKSALLQVPLDEYLVSKNLCSEDLAKRYADLHLTDLLFPLFSRDALEIEFKEERPQISDFVTQLPISYVLKEAERRGGEWPELRRRVGSQRAVYTKESSVLAELLGYVDPNPEDEEPLPELSGSARVVFFHINGKKTVEQIARATGLGMHETYRGIRELLDGFLLEIVTHEGPGERPPKRSALTRLVTWVTSALILVLIGFGGQWLAANPEVLALDRTAGSASILSQVQAAHLAQVRVALEIYHVQKQEYPETLADLVNARLLAGATEASMGALRYVRRADGYALSARGDSDAPPAPSGERGGPPVEGVDELKSYGVYGVFNDVTGLAKSSPIMLSGNRVGHIESIQLDTDMPDRARVTMLFDRQAIVYEGVFEPKTGGWRDGAAVTPKQGAPGVTHISLAPGVTGKKLGDGGPVRGVIVDRRRGSVLDQPGAK